jgi:hypothetical protein
LNANRLNGTIHQDAPQISKCGKIIICKLLRRRCAEKSWQLIGRCGPLLAINCNSCGPIPISRAMAATCSASQFANSPPPSRALCGIFLTNWRSHRGSAECCSDTLAPSNTGWRIVLVWYLSHDCAEQGPDARGHSHGQSTPKRDAYCARRDTRAAGTRSQCTQKCEEQQ